MSIESQYRIWDCQKNGYVTQTQDMIDFLEEIDMVCEKYGYSISHEDGHGSFIIEKYKEENIEWLKNASQDLS